MGLFSEQKNGATSDDPFIFSWKNTTRSTWHLILFVLFSTLIHGSGFYLFQVVYPEPVRIEPTPNQITILDSSSPEVRSTIQRVKDRTVFLTPPSGDSSVRVQLRDHAVRLTPSFTKVAPVFLPPREKSSLVPPPSTQGKPAEPNEKKVELRLSPDLEKRGLAPWSILRDYLEQAEGIPRLKVNLIVLPDGKIEKAEIEGEDIPDDSREEFNQAVKSTLRFNAITSGNQTAPMQGWIEIHPIER